MNRRTFWRSLASGGAAIGALTATAVRAAQKDNEPADGHTAITFAAQRRVLQPIGNSVYLQSYEYTHDSVSIAPGKDGLYLRLNSGRWRRIATD